MVSVDAPDYLAYQYRTYSLPVAVAKANDSVHKVTANINLPVGILRGCIIIFPPGCERHVYAQLFHGGTQVVPYVAGSYLCEDGFTFDLSRDKIYEEIPNWAMGFSVIAWNDNNTTVEVDWPHTLGWYFFVEVGGI